MELKFNNGKFRIMQIADTQDTNKTSPATVEFIRYSLKIVKPDLVVFTGDKLRVRPFQYRKKNSLRFIKHTKIAWLLMLTTKLTVTAITTSPSSEKTARRN